MRFVFALLVLFSGTQAFSSGFPDGYTYYTSKDMQKALTQANQEQRNVLVYLGSVSRCGGCQYISSQLGVAEAKKVYGQFRHNIQKRGPVLGIPSCS